MSKAFPPRVPQVVDGEPVNAAVAGRPSRALEQRTNSLKEQIDASEAGQLLVDPDQSIDPALQIGQAVYWNPTSLRYEAALAEVVSDEATGSLVQSPRSDCLGLLLHKPTSTVGTIAIAGRARFQSLAEAIDGEIVPGRYFLSSAEPGKLVRQRPPATVFVCYIYGPATACETDIQVMILPQSRDFMEDHIHHRYDLVCRPAGDVNPTEAEQSGRHEITNADDELEGWLPAAHPVFAGNAPDGACFGYNLKASPRLKANWPPVPVSAAELYWDKGEGLVGATLVDSRSSDQLVVLDAFGIWWMSDCYGDVPWPAGLLTGEGDISESLASISAECPREERMRIVLAFLHMVFATDKTVVTSLQPDENEPIGFFDCNGVPAKQGDLYARLLLEAAVTNDVRGGRALKNVRSAPFGFDRGWVMEGLIAGSENIVLSGDHSVLSDPDDPNSPLMWQGRVTADVRLNQIDSELNPQITRLGDALERPVKGVLALALPKNRTSSLLMKFTVPPAGLPNNPKLKLRIQLFGRQAGVTPALTLSYYRVPRANVTPVVLNETQTSVALAASLTVAADTVYEVESDVFTIVAGDTVFLLLTRSEDATPVYNAEIDILRVGGIVVSGT